MSSRKNEFIEGFTWRGTGVYLACLGLSVIYINSPPPGGVDGASRRDRESVRTYEKRGVRVFSLVVETLSADLTAWC